MTVFLKITHNNCCSVLALSPLITFGKNYVFFILISTYIIIYIFSITLFYVYNIHNYVFIIIYKIIKMTLFRLFTMVKYCVMCGNVDDVVGVSVHKYIYNFTVPIHIFIKMTH